jgi:hypothetical protein
MFLLDIYIRFFDIKLLAILNTRLEGVEVTNYVKESLVIVTK